MSEKSRAKDKAHKEAQAKARAERGATYTHDELDELIKKDPLLVDDDRLGPILMPFMPGRFYSRMYFVNFPDIINPPHGGDISAILYRRDDDLVKWFLRYRFRYYAGKSIWNNADKKNYYSAKFLGTHEDALDSTKKFFETVAKVGSKKLNEFVIEGDSEKASGLLMDPATRPNWMSMGVGKLEKGKTTRQIEQEVCAKMAMREVAEEFKHTQGDN